MVYSVRRISSCNKFAVVSSITTKYISQSSPLVVLMGVYVVLVATTGSLGSACREGRFSSCLDDPD